MTLISYAFLLILEVTSDGDSFLCESEVWIVKQGRISVV